MKITFINRMAGILRGGGEQFELEAARALTQLGHNVQFVIGRRWSRLDMPMTEFPVTYVRTPYLRWLMYRGEASHSRILQRIGGLAKWLDLDIFERMAFKKIMSTSIHEQTDVFQISGLPRLGAWLCQKTRAKSVVLWHGPPSPKVRLWNEKCSGTLACGHSISAVQRNADPKAVLIYPGVDTTFFKRIPASDLRTRYGIPENGIVFIFVGRLVYVKNVPFLLESFSAALKENPLLYLIIVGDGPLRPELIEQAKQLGLSRHAIFAGYQEGEALVRHYCVADALVITSIYENFPMVTLEAMACELPVIATSVGGLPDLVEEGQTGFLVESDNIGALKSALLTIAESPVLRRSMGQLGREKVVRKYNWLETARQMVAVYQGFQGLMGADRQ